MKCCPFLHKGLAVDEKRESLAILPSVCLGDIMKSFVFFILVVVLLTVGFAQKSNQSSPEGVGINSPLSKDIQNAEARRTFDLVNRERVSQGLQPLTYDPVCQRAAEEHTEAMIQQNFFAHNAPHENFRERMSRWDLLRYEAGENLAETNSAEEAVAGWMQSPSHRKNILSPNFRSAGLAYKNRIYTQCFSGKVTP